MLPDSSDTLFELHLLTHTAKRKIDELAETGCYIDTLPSGKVYCLIQKDNTQYKVEWVIGDKTLPAITLNK